MNSIFEEIEESGVCTEAECDALRSADVPSNGKCLLYYLDSIVITVEQLGNFTKIKNSFWWGIYLSAKKILENKKYIFESELPFVSPVSVENDTEGGLFSPGFLEDHGIYSAILSCHLNKTNSESLVRVVWLWMEILLALNNVKSNEKCWPRLVYAGSLSFRKIKLKAGINSSSWDALNDFNGNLNYMSALLRSNNSFLSSELKSISKVIDYSLGKVELNENEKEKKEKSLIIKSRVHKGNPGFDANSVLIFRYEQSDGCEVIETGSDDVSYIFNYKSPDHIQKKLKSIRRGLRKNNLDYNPVDIEKIANFDWLELLGRIKLDEAESPYTRMGLESIAIFVLALISGKDLVQIFNMEVLGMTSEKPKKYPKYNVEKCELSWGFSDDLLGTKVDKINPQFDEVRKSISIIIPSCLSNIFEYLFGNPIEVDGEDGWRFTTRSKLSSYKDYFKKIIDEVGIDESFVCSFAVSFLWGKCKLGRVEAQYYRGIGSPIVGATRYYAVYNFNKLNVALGEMYFLLFGSKFTYGSVFDSDHYYGGVYSVPSKKKIKMLSGKFNIDKSFGGRRKRSPASVILAHNKYTKRFIWFYLSITGVRPSKVIKINPPVLVCGKYFIVVDDKSVKKFYERIIPVSNRLCSIINNYFDSCDLVPGKYRINNFPFYIDEDNYECEINQNYYRNMFDRDGSLSFSCFRRLLVGYLSKKCIPEVYISALLGHRKKGTEIDSDLSMFNPCLFHEVVSPALEGFYFEYIYSGDSV